MAEHLEDLALQTRGLVRHFGSVRAVDGLDLEVPRGSIYAFLGPNGAGKTTTIRLILGLMRPDAGEITLLGHPVATTDPRFLLARVGALVETPVVYPHLTGRENLAITALLLGLSGSATSAVASALETVGLAEAADRPAGRYSLGMRQRLGIGRALLGRPELLILDEPTNGLDPAGIQEIRRLLLSLAAKGTTVLLSSHLLAEVEQIAERVGVVQRGRLLFQGPLADFSARGRGAIRVALDRPEEAIRLLADSGWRASATSGEYEIRIDTAAADAPAQINRLLVQAGFAVSSLSRERSSLEAAFLELTERGEHDA